MLVWVCMLTYIAAVIVQESRLFQPGINNTQLTRLTYKIAALIRLLRYYLKYTYYMPYPTTEL